MKILGGECSGIIPELFIMFSYNPDLYIHNRFRVYSRTSAPRARCTNSGNHVPSVFGDIETPQCMYFCIFYITYRVMNGIFLSYAL